MELGKINEMAYVMSVALSKFSFHVTSCYDPVVFPAGCVEPWEFWEAPLELLRRGRGRGSGRWWGAVLPSIGAAGLVFVYILDLAEGHV